MPAVASDAQPVAEPVVSAQAMTAGSISGAVRSTTGAFVSGATVTVKGPKTATATTDDSGGFTIAVPPGIYSVTIDKGGYQPVSLGNIVVAAGQAQPLAISLAPVDLTTLRTIGSVSTGSSRALPINTGAAAQTFVGAQQFANLANPTVNDVLQRVPDVVIQKMGTQADTSIVVGGLQPYETQVLIDGHPIALGQYGVWFSQYFPSYFTGGAEVESGPGNTTPFANIAVAGTVNLTTPAFTTKPTAQYTEGIDTYQSQYANLLLTGSTGGLQYVLGAGTAGDNGYYFGKTECDVYDFDYGTTPNSNGSAGVVPFCGDFSGSFHNRGVLGKLRYNFSPATAFDVTFLGTFGGYSPQGSAWGESYGPTTVEACLPGQNVCTSPQNANLIGTTINGFYWFPGTEITNTQQLYSGQFRTTLGTNSIVDRPYVGALQPETYDGTNEGSYAAFYAPNATYPACPAVGTPAPDTCYAGPPSLAPGVAIPGAYNNTYLNNPNYFEAGACPPGNIGSFNQINSPINTIVSQGGQEECYQYPYSTYEQDKLYGNTFSFIHPFGDSTLDFTYDFHGSSTFAYINSPSNYSVPAGSATRFSTFSLTGNLAMINNLGIDFGLYNTNWTAFGQQPVTNAAGDVLYYGGLDRTVSRFDPHVALTFHPASSTSYRLSFGTSETFPFIADLSGAAINQPPAFQFTAGSVTEKNAGLLPEFSAAYAGGVDHRFSNGSVLSLDLQDTVVHNVFQQSTITETVPYLGGFGLLGIFAPINVARLESRLATVKYTDAPVRGFGFNLSATADRSIMTGIPAAVYNGNPGLPANGVQVCGGASFTPGLATCIPYLKGYAQLTYTTHRGGFVGLGVDYEGKNNAYYQPPFAIADFTYRQPLTKIIELQLAVQNLFNSDTFNQLPAADAGQPAVGNLTTDGVTIQQGSFTTYLIPAPTRTLRIQLRAHLGRS